MTRCGLCSVAIGNPVCPLCLTDKVEGWIEHRRLSLVKRYREQVRNVLDMTRYSKISCSVCRGENEKAICIKCFLGKIYDWLAVADKQVAKDFIRAFTPKTAPKLYA